MKVLFIIFGFYLFLDFLHSIYFYKKLKEIEKKFNNFKKNCIFATDNDS